MIFETESRKGLDAIETSLREAAARHQFGVLSVINLKDKMHEKGVQYDSECSVFEVCNPHQAKRALDSNGAVSTALPCRISVYGSGGAYKIATIRPTVMLKMFGSPGIEQVAQEVENDLIEMIKESA